MSSNLAFARGGFSSTDDFCVASWNVLSFDLFCLRSHLRSLKSGFLRLFLLPDLRIALR